MTRNGTSSNLASSSAVLASTMDELLAVEAIRIEVPFRVVNPPTEGSSMIEREWLYRAAFDYADAQGATYDEVSAFASETVNDKFTLLSMAPDLPRKWKVFRASQQSGSSW